MTELPTDQQTETIWIHLGEAPLDVAAADTFLRTERAGGLTLFVDTTRRWTDGRETIRLAYDAHAPMAIKTMRTLADEATAGSERRHRRSVCAPGRGVRGEPLAHRRAQGAGTHLEARALRRRLGRVGVGPVA